jgi:hypothetical protein
MKRVSVIRKWKNPSVEVRVADESIQVDMDLRDFLAALVEESAEEIVSGAAANAGNPSFWFTRGKVEAAVAGALDKAEAVASMNAAADRILAEMKRKSVLV